MGVLNKLGMANACMLSFLGSTSAAAMSANVEQPVAMAEQETTPAASASPSSPSAASEQRVGLGEIVVTAQRKAESLQRAAIPVDVVSGGEVTKALVSRPSQLNNLVPSLQVGTAGGSSATFYLRGVGTTTTSSYTDSAIAFNLDGVYIARPSSTSGYFYDLERVEVLKGPQGTLYGRNATGGAINVIPAKPKIGETSIDASIVLGNFDTVNLQSAVNLATSDTSALRIAGVYAKHDGYLSDGTSDQNERAIRVQYAIEPTPDLNVRISADYQRRQGAGAGTALPGYYSIDYANNRYIITETDFDERGIGYFDPRVAPLLAANNVLAAGGPIPQATKFPTLDGHFWGVMAQIDWATPVGTLTVLPSYRHTKISDANAGGGTILSDNQRAGETSVEARLAGSAGSIDYIVGGLYFHDKLNATSSPNFQVVLVEQTYRTTTRSLAGFGRLTYHVSDALRLVGGIRYTNDKKTLAGFSQILATSCTLPGETACAGSPLIPYSKTIEEAIAALQLVQVPAPVPFPAYIQPSDPNGPRRLFLLLPADVHDDKLSQSRLTYRLAAEFDLAPSSLLYASFETGFRSGGFAFSPTKPSYGPEKINAWTIGSKNRLFDDRLQLNLEAFYWKYSAQQVSHFDDAGVFVTENIGRSTIKGIEVETQWLATPTTLLSFDGQYLDAVNDDFRYTTAGAINPVLSTPTNTVYLPAYNGCPNSTSAAGTITIDCSGKQAQFSPKWTFTAAVQQTVPLGDSKMVLTAGTRYQSASWTGIDYQPQDRQKGYWTSRADVTFLTPGEQLSISAFVSNIENNRHPLVTGSFGLTQLLTASLTDPRTYGVRMSLTF